MRENKKDDSVSAFYALAEVARLLPKDVDACFEQLKLIGNLADILLPIQTDGIEPLVYLGLDQIEISDLRLDVPSSPLALDLIMSNAPECSGSFFSVPQAMEEQG